MVETADFLIVIGTSLAVYPAAGLVHYASPEITKFIIDPDRPAISSYDEWVHIEKRSATGTPELVNRLL